MKRDLDIIRKLLQEAEKSEERWFDIGVWQWTDHDMRSTELNSKLDSKTLFHLDLMEQGNLINKMVCEHSEVEMWEISFNGYEFLDATRSNGLWEKLKSEAKEQGIALTVQSVITTGMAVGSQLPTKAMTQ